MKNGVMTNKASRTTTVNRDDKKSHTLIYVKRHLTNKLGKEKNLMIQRGFKPSSFRTLVRYFYQLGYWAQMAAECRIGIIHVHRN